jgi:hypothetical protein
MEAPQYRPEACARSRLRDLAISTIPEDPKHKFERENSGKAARLDGGPNAHGACAGDHKAAAELLQSSHANAQFTRGLLLRRLRVAQGQNVLLADPPGATSASSRPPPRHVIP